MNKIWQEYRRTLEKEIGEELAHEFVDSLHSQSHGCVKVATQFFYDLGIVWAPLMCAWSEWVKQNAQWKIAIILRGAEPLTAISSTKNWRQFYLNRLLCGITDELSGDKPSKEHPLLTRYLSQCGCLKNFTFVDSGCYGTIVLKLHNLGITFQPLFFFSKNPSIPGFLNGCGISEGEGTILNDSLECALPHIYARPSELVEANGKVEVVLCSSDPLSVRLGKAAMSGIRDAQVRSNVSGKEAAQTLLRLSKNARRN